MALSDRLMRVALAGVVPADDPHVLADVMLEIERLRQALQDIAEPMAGLQRAAEAEGATLNRNAPDIANNVGYLRSIARAALAEGEK